MEAPVSAQNDYFRWLSSWAISVRKPSDLNYDDNGYILPELNINPVITDSDYRPTDELFFSGLRGLKQRADIRKQTIDNKIAEIIKLTQGSEQWIIWCGLDIESKSAKGVLSDSVEVKGNG